MTRTARKITNFFFFVLAIAFMVGFLGNLHGPSTWVYFTLGVMFAAGGFWSWRILKNTPEDDTDPEK